MKKGYRELLREANEIVDTVPVGEAMAMHGSPDAVFVDLRDPREIKRDGKIPGAISCPRGMLEFWIDPDSPYHKPVFAMPHHFVFYCASGWRSALAARIAMEMGLERVSHIEGGLTAWRAAGGQIDLPKF